MCGIAAIFSYYRSADLVDEPELLRIREAMLNRGPDGAGLWVSDDKRIGLAHRRLAIIDLSDAGAQPMSTADGRIRIVFNGEIYNYQALRARLMSRGFRFRSHSDTEVLLHLYREHGREMVQRLRGMFAFALWDEKAQGLLLARDPFGIKPLYYSDDGSTIRVASQVKALLKGGKVDTAPEPAGHVGFYLWGHVPEPFTLYKGIRALAAGTSLWVDAGGRQDTRRFFNMTAELAEAGATPLSLSRGEMHERLRAALLDTVRHHLIADVPVGVFLSAGLDSTTLAALAREVGHSGLHTVTLGFKEYRDTNNDETPIAERFAKQYRTAHSTRWVAKEEFQSDYKDLLDAMDQPSVDGVNSYFVAKAASEAGLKVALSGLGGDELFGGYSCFQQIPRMVRGTSLFQLVPYIGRGFRRVSASTLTRFTSPKYAGVLEYGGTYGGAYLLRRGLYMPWELPDLLDGELVRKGWRDLRLLSRLEETTRGIDNVHLKVSSLETSWYMQNQLLRDTDWASMTHSLEVRVPLVDVELFRAVTPLFHSPNPPSKRAMADVLQTPLPEEVLKRPKTGFSIPVREWLLEAGVGRSRPPGRDLRSWAGWVIHNVAKEQPRELASVHWPDSGRGTRIAQPALSSARLLNDGSDRKDPRQVALLASEMTSHGGIQSFMHRIIDVLARLSPVAGVESHCFSLNDEPERLRRIPAVSLLSTAWGARKSKMRLAARLLLTRQRFDVMIVGHIGMAPLALAMKWSGRLGCYYVQLHGIEAWRKVSRLERLALLGSRGILATTTHTAESCAAHNNIPADLFHIVPLCASEQAAAPALQFRLNGAFKLLCVARQDKLERYKGFETIFHALAALRPTLPGIHLNMIGDGDDQARLRKVTEELGIASQVTFWGHLPEEELAAAYGDCDVFVMPSKKEGFGIVFLEAMRLGKPCIGGNHGGTPDVIEHGKSGYLVEFGDAPVLAQSIRALLENPSLRKEMGEAGRALVEGKFSWHKFQTDYAKLVTAARNP